MPRIYDLELKKEAVRMASNEVEKRLGIGHGVVSKWQREFARDEQQAFAGKSNLNL